MDKYDKHIMVIPRDQLFESGHFEGFRHNHETDYESRILEHFTYMKRGLAEKDPGYKQPIGYALVINPKLKKVFSFMRSEQGDEGLLFNKWSWGVGGHIDKTEENENNPIYSSLLREFNEEVYTNGTVKNIKALGYINEEDDASSVHFGILYVIETDATEVNPKDKEIDIGKLMSLDEIEEICSSPEHNVEGWSMIALDPLKKYLEELV
jgi:predicted NUDIX family phosphoesterase